MTIKLIKYLNLIILLLAASAVYAETTNCTAITSIPYKITEPGVYCLTGNLSLGKVTGRAIFIDADDVVLDLNGWTLEGTGGLATLLVGIKAYQRKNITIRNGTIRGFYRAIYLADLPPYTTSQGHLIEDIHADSITYMGIQVFGRVNTVRRNQLGDTGGSTVNQWAIGIYLRGAEGRVLNNDISSTVATGSGEARGVYLGNASGAVVEGNRINDVSRDTGFAYGIIIVSSSYDVLFRGNSITSADFGIRYVASTGKYMDNLTSNVTAPFLGGTAVGINN